MAGPEAAHGPLRRLLHFAEDGDTSGFFPQLARWHDRAGYRMVFGTLRPMDPPLRDYMESHGVACMSCECRHRGEYPLGLLRLVRFLRSQSVDIVHTHLFDPSIVGLQAGMLAGTPLRMLTRHHSDYHTRIGKRWHTRLDRLCTHLADAVVAVSQHAADHLISIEGAPPSKVHVIPNGIDLERVSPAAGARERIRRELGCGSAALLLTAARLHPEKGYEHLFAALPTLRQSVQRPFILVVAGTGPREATYRALVRDLGCEDIVRFVGFRTDLPDLMAAADVFVLASVAEAFGLVLAEALYIGTPVVATTAGAIPEIVANGVDGLLVPPGDSAALADALATLLVHEATRRRMVGAGHEKVVRRFRFQDMLRSYEHLYESLLARGPNRSRAVRLRRA
jgi:glycosyltransferase involved in cell wall biosynthesis